MKITYKNKKMIIICPSGATQELTILELQAFKKMQEYFIAELEKDIVEIDKDIQKINAS